MVGASSSSLSSWVGWGEVYGGRQRGLSGVVARTIRDYPVEVMSSRSVYWTESARHSGSFDFGTETQSRGEAGPTRTQGGVKGDLGIAQPDAEQGRRVRRMQKNQELEERIAADKEGIPAHRCADATKHRETEAGPARRPPTEGPRTE